MSDNFIVYRKKYQNLQTEQHGIVPPLQYVQSNLIFRRHQLPSRPEEYQVQVSALSIFLIAVGIIGALLGVSVFPLPTLIRYVLITVGILLSIGTLASLLFPKD